MSEITNNIFLNFMDQKKRLQHPGKMCHSQCTQGEPMLPAKQRIATVYKWEGGRGPEKPMM